jgi:hypothetical protein
LIKLFANAISVAVVIAQLAENQSMPAMLVRERLGMKTRL